MTAALFSAAGKLFECSPFSWRVTLTTGIPCDSFSLTLPAIDAVLDACRVEILGDGGATVLRGVIDRTTLSHSGGETHISGRGMAALLLDTEAVPARFDRFDLKTMETLLLAPLGLRREGGDALPHRVDFSVEPGMSHFGVVTRFIEGSADVYPRFTGDGALNLRPSPRPKNPPEFSPGGTLTLRRGGRTGSALIRDRDSPRTLTVKNPVAEKLGLHGRAVFTGAGAAGMSEMQRSALRLIAGGEENAFTLTAALPGDPGLRPCDWVAAQGGVWMVGQCVLSGDGSEITLINV